MGEFTKRLPPYHASETEIIHRRSVATKTTLITRASDDN